MNKESRILPPGYRYLKPGEKINKGDFFWNVDKNRWLKIAYNEDMCVWATEQIIRIEMYHDKEDN
jgi:hypothetical protein